MAFARAWRREMAGRFFGVADRRAASASRSDQTSLSGRVSRVLRIMNRSHRLRYTSDIVRVRTDGVKMSTLHVVFFVTKGFSATTRVAIPITRRFGSAVHRNRIRRRIREVLRHEIEKLQRPLDIVVIPRRDVVLAAENEIRLSVRNGLREACSRVQQ